MPSNNRPEKISAVKNQKQICPKCSFENNLAAVYCEICFYPLDISGSLMKQPPTFKPQPNNRYSNSQSNFQQEIRKPSVLIGLAVLIGAIALWIDYFNSRRPDYLNFSERRNHIALYDSMTEVKRVPQGLFNYGGALYFASLVAHGMNDAILQEYPNFALRYTKPKNNDQSYANGIQMLLDGELSFAFNGRSLVDREYYQAHLRSFNLQQVPIAIDGIVFFANPKVMVDGISIDRVRDIFTGKITNWQELGGEDLAITPVMLTPENIEILSLDNPNKIPQTTEYVDNYTLALRKVIATPGAISFASASLVQKQELIKILSLAPENSTNYVAPFDSQGKPNLELFKNGSYPLTRRLFLVLRQDGTPDWLAGKAYAEMIVSNQGQEIVEKAGFVPIYKDQ